MASIIKIKRSNTGGSAPSSSSLAAGELAVNLADLILYSSSDGTDVIQIAENALANTNSYIGTKLNSSSYTTADVQAKAALANTNSAIALRATEADSLLRLSNTNSYIATKLDSASYTTADVQAKAALANTNSYIASVYATGQQNLANTNARIDAVSTSFTLAADSGSNDSFTSGGTLTISGTANEVATAVTDDTITISLPDDVTIGRDLTVSQDLAVSGNTVITGNLIVNGSTTTVTSSTVSVNDSLLKLGANNAADSVDLGWYGEYVAAGTKYAGVFRDASASGDPFVFWKDLTSEPTTTVNFGSGSLATIEAVIDGGTY